MTLPRIYLIDSSIYIFRAWHIYDETILDRDGRPANAIFGFCDFLYQLIRQTKTRHIACAFDASQTNSYRKGLYPAYKANREPAPDALRYQFAQCRDFCRVVGIPEYGSDRFEADDIIGSLAHRYREQGYAITVVSADKDLTQLVLGDEDRWWDFARGTVLDQHGVKKQFGVRPDLIADLLALSGDKVDNIPGIPGVGYATAAKLLQKYEGVEPVLANMDKIAAMKFRGAARIQALLASYHGILTLNKQLTTIVTNMEFNPEPAIAMGSIQLDEFEALTEQLALSSSLKNRWLSLVDN